MAALMNGASVPHGMRAIRQIRKLPSERLKKKIHDTYEYFLEKVDPIVGSCITYMLLEQPSDVLTSMIDYLKLYKSTKGHVNVDHLRVNHRPRKEMKLFLATTIGPIIAKLVNRVSAVQPVHIIDFMIDELRSMKDEDAMNADVPYVEPPKLLTDPEAEPRNIQLCMLGLGGAGKSSLINMLIGNFDSKPKPTLGFRPFTMLLGRDNIKFYDLGGGKKIRDIWNQYYHDVHGVIYVVDAAACPDTLQESTDTFHEIIKHDYLAGKPVLILVNKKDLPNSHSANQIRDLMRLHTLPDLKYTIAECSSYLPDEYDENFKMDPRIETAFESLLNGVLNSFDSINTKVLLDIQKKAAEETRRRIDRERKVLKNKIASAFYDQLSLEVLATVNAEVDPNSIFSEEEGLTFLAAEIGEEVSRLPDQALSIASMAGYQRLALQIIGALKAPISKKKIAMSWDEIHALIVELRQELELF
jgi:ADP-ribosylation factor-like protein 13B